MSGVLGRIRVLDLGQGIAGPLCAQLLGDHGADVIKVEPPRGDWSRTMGAPDEHRMSATFICSNRNKRGTCIDLSQAEGLAAVRALALDCDVIVENYRPGVMNRIGLGYETLAAENPRLIYCAISGFGETGPNVHLPASDSTMQAYAGLMSVVGERDGQPLRVGNMVVDMVAATNAFSGILMAIIARASTGRGQRIAMSLLDSAIAFQAPVLTEYLRTGVEPRRLGNDNPLFAPSGAATTSDGIIMYTVYDHYWRAFCEKIAMPALADDPRFDSTGARQSNREALKRILDAVFATRTSAQWLSELRSMDIQCSPVHSYSQLLADPQVLHNQMLMEIGPAAFPGFRNAVRMGSEARDVLPPPRLGEHTRDVLSRDGSEGDGDLAAWGGPAFGSKLRPSLTRLLANKRLVSC